MLKLLGHPFSSYTWKALIPLYENSLEFQFLSVDAGYPDNIDLLRKVSPQGKFPVLLDGERVVLESSCIVEYLHHYYPGPTSLVPADFDGALEVRTMDRFFDNYVMTPAQAIVNDFLRAPDLRDPLAVEQAKTLLQRSYHWLDSYLEGKTWACGDFSLADCAAAPSLFYADWLCEIDEERVDLRQYRQRLLARPSVKRCVDDARPYRCYFPAGAPDRD